MDSSFFAIHSEIYVQSTFLRAHAELLEADEAVRFYTIDDGTYEMNDGYPVPAAH